MQQRHDHQPVGSGGADDADIAAKFSSVLRDEILAARPDQVIPPDAGRRRLDAAIDSLKVPLSALCLSGGGIRSASFALGILQGLARFGVLGQFDYLSTVSGGGYIGSWLTAWRHHAQSDQEVFDGLDRTKSPTGDEAPQIQKLRYNSNYLTPRLGLLSADTWTVVALTIRNLVLNWLVFLPFFMGVLYFPWLCFDLLSAAPGWSASVPLLMPFGIASATAGLAFASYGRRRASGGWLTDGRFVVLVVGPLILAATAFVTPLAGLAERPPALHRGAFAGVASYAVAWLVASAFYRRYRGEHQSRAAQETCASQVADLVTWIAAGAIAGSILTLGMRLSIELGPTYRIQWLTALGTSWTMLSIFGGELIYVGLRSYAARGDTDREWLARASGWLTAGAASWTGLTAVALFGPHLLYVGTQYVVAWLTVGGLSGATALTLASGAKTAATAAAGRISLDQIASVAGAVFAVFLATCLSILDVQVSSIVTGICPRVWPWVVDLGGFALLIAVSAIISWFVNINRFSLHAVYRNRLMRAFLGSARATSCPARQPDPFTSFDQSDNLTMARMPTTKLFHVVNTTLNVVSTSNLAWQERKAEPFAITPLSAGNPTVGYRPTETYGAPRGGITLGTALAISGAAVSPNMGYHSSPLLGFLLMLFNVRLGWWLGNPAQSGYGREGPTFSLVPLLTELASRTTDSKRWVYLSDGGHFENLGIYEMVRRRCRMIVVSDAGADPACAFEDLGNALRKIYIDLGASIDFEALDLSGRRTPPVAGTYCALGRITYPGSKVPGWLLYIKPGYHGDEPASIRSYAIAHTEFPNELTADQWFSELQFEAYRALGAHIAELICSGGQTVPTMEHPPPIDLQALEKAANEYLSGAAGHIKR